MGRKEEKMLALVQQMMEPIDVFSASLLVRPDEGGLREALTQYREALNELSKTLSRRIEGKGSIPRRLDEAS
jgi:hypothetical protein